MPTYRDEAIVLRTYSLGEADRIIVLFTRLNGKVRAIAKGVRRTSSKFGGALEPGNHLDAQLAEGRGSLDVVAQIDGRHVFDFAAHYPTFTAAQVLLEGADRLVAEDRVPAIAQFRLLLGALVALNKGVIAPADIVDSYLLRGLAIAGYALAIDNCASCGSNLDQGGWYAPNLGGLVCDHCRSQAANWVEKLLIDQLGALLAGNWEQISRDTSIQRRCSGMIRAFTQWQLEHRLRTLDYFVTE